MNNEHNIQDLDVLYSDSNELLTTILNDKIDSGILIDIDNSINKLFECWNGQDAYVQVNNLINLYNSFIDIRQSIGNTGVYLANLAKSYREIQITNGAVLDTLGTASFSEKAKKEEYGDLSGSIFLNNDLSNVTILLNEVIEKIEDLVISINNISKSIFSNWIQGGENKSYAMDLFDNIIANLKQYIDDINAINDNINKAILNYSSGLESIKTMPGLAAMNAGVELSNDAVVEEKNMKEHYEANMNANKVINDDFNSQLKNSVISDLKGKGIL